jgi:hypothetical protein
MKAVGKQKRRPGLPRTMSIPEAGWEFYGLGEAASYAAAKRGDIPYVQVGSLKRVPIALMEQKLADCGAGPPASKPRGRPRNSVEPLDASPPALAAAPE